MPRTPDRSPGEADEEGIVLVTWSAGNDPASAGGIRYVNGAFRLRDALGVFNPRAPLDELLTVDPDEASTTYTPTYAADLITQESWVDVATSRELKRVAYTFSGDCVITEVVKVFDPADGTTIVAQKTITYSYLGDRVLSAAIVRDV